MRDDIKKLLEERIKKQKEIQEAIKKVREEIEKKKEEEKK